MSDLFHFEWPVDQNGYEIQRGEAAEAIAEAPIENAAPRPPSLFDPLPGEAERETVGTGGRPGGRFGFGGLFSLGLGGPPQLPTAVIRRKGGPLRYYRPLETGEGIHRRLAKLDSSDEAALEFVSTYGTLGTALFGKAIEEQEIWDFHFARQSVQQIIAAIDANNRAEAFDLFNRQSEGFRPTKMTPRIHEDKRGRRSMTLVPDNLLAFIWLQIAGEITHGIEWRNCRNCPTWFQILDPRSKSAAAGKATKRREFCSDRCRGIWNRAQNRPMA